MKVQVLMSSYNGEKYIREQIESILNQRDVEVSILIRDDGSEDSTRKILGEMNDSRIACAYEENIGVKKSFLKLIAMSDPDADYYAFSDQDDIWLEDKLSTAVKFLSREDQTVPLVYGSSVSLYMNGEVIGEQFICSQLNLGNFLIKNYYPGCTMVFNKKLAELINMVDINVLKPNPLHDHWLNLVCTACGGKVLIDTKPHILYRQHEGNVIGDRSLFQKIKGNGLLTHSENTRFKICEELHELYGAYEDNHSSVQISTILNYKKGFMNRLRLAFSKEIKPTSATEKIAIILIAAMGKF